MVCLSICLPESFATVFRLPQWDNLRQSQAARFYYVTYEAVFMFSVGNGLSGYGRSPSAMSE
jgi:hypothetical protein